MKNADKPAYPTLIQTSSPDCWDTMNGLTKREMFAMAAMQGILSSSYKYDPAIYNSPTPNDLAEDAIKYADTILKQLEQ